MHRLENYTRNSSCQFVWNFTMVIHKARSGLYWNDQLLNSMVLYWYNACIYPCRMWQYVKSCSFLFQWGYGLKPTLGIWAWTKAGSRFDFGYNLYRVFFFPNKFLLLILQLGNTDNFSVTRCFFAWCPRLFRLPTVSLGHLSLLVCTEKGPSLACKRKFGNAKWITDYNSPLLSHLWIDT